MNIFYPKQPHKIIYHATNPVVFRLVFISKRLLALMIKKVNISDWHTPVFTISEPMEYWFQVVAMAPGTNCVFCVKTDKQIIF